MMEQEAESIYRKAVEDAASSGEDVEAVAQAAVDAWATGLRTQVYYASGEDDLKN